MASAHLDFIPPDVPDLTKLRIYESTTEDGTFALIEEITGVGAYPTYISEYTTNLATNVDNWFAIDWVDSKGFNVGISQAIKGRTSLLVGEIVRRIQLRDTTISEKIAQQEAEAVIERYFGVDPYTLETTEAKYWQKSGLTALAMARIYTVGLVQSGTVSSWTAGLISVKNEAGRETRTNITELLKEAQRVLGLTTGKIAQMAALEIAGGGSDIVSIDQSRLLIEIEP